MSFRLIPQWRQAWRMHSMQAMGVAAAIQGAWYAIPDDLRASLPDWAPTLVTVAILACGIVGRVVDQGIVTPSVGREEP